MKPNQNILSSIIMNPYSDLKPLLILHGFLGMSDNWKTLATHYASKGFEVHVLDLRNHGRSFHSSEFNYNVMVQDIKNYCSFHRITIFDIIGHSMGGKTALFFATEYQEMVSKLIVLDIGTKYYAPHHQDIMMGLNAIDFTKQPTRNDVEKILINYIPDFGTRQFLMKNLYWKTPEQLAFRFNLNAFNKNISEIGLQLNNKIVFKKPTLFVRGGKSNYILDQDFDEIKEHFPLSKIITIPNVGHWLHAENPKMFLDISLDFLLK